MGCCASQLARPIILSRLSWQGSVPGTWGVPDTMQSLVTMDLSFNQLTGSLPSFLTTTLPNVSQILLQNNSLAGTIPSRWLDGSACALIQHRAVTHV